MRAFVVFTAVFAVAFARPDVSHLSGYNYDEPSVSSGGGSSSGGTSLNHNDILTDPTIGREAGSLFQGISSYEAPLVSGNDAGFSNAGALSVRTGSESSGSFGGSSSSFGGSFGGSSGGGGIVYTGSDTVERGSAQVIDLAGNDEPQIRSGGGNSGVEISKSFFLHEAPEEEARFEAGPVSTNTKKHYKIIFVKAPSESGGAGGAQQLTQHEEKTIVYVLSKKGGAQGQDALEQPAPVTNKPDVFFIKYKNQADSENIVQQVQQSFREGGEGYDSPGAFARTLGATGGGAGQSFTSSSSGGSFTSSSSTGGFSQGVSAGGYSGNSVSTGQSSSGYIQPQQMVEIPSSHSAFHQKYLPPNRRF